jgi:thiol:disulfide interchange protein
MEPATTHAMKMRLSSPLLALAISLAGCDAPGVRLADAPSEALPSAQPPAQRAPTEPSPGVWGDAVAWRDWETALRIAKAENKSLCVVVYADWCPRCKELAPVFTTPEVASAAANLVMVRQDQDEHPAWLKEHLGSYGDSIPRILFLDPSGHVREDLQSGHPRFPYFYAPLVTDRLLANMHAASGR